MNEATQGQALKAAINHATDLLTESWPQIVKTMGEASIEAGRHEKERFKFPVAWKVVLEPSGQECRVSAAIRYGASKSDTTDPTSVGPMPLFEGRQAKQEAAR
jgi:hypothetical protein